MLDLVHYADSETMLILGIESSCDETSAAVVDDARTILSNIVLSQHAAHQPFGGVVPEIAAREHIVHMDTVIHQALAHANVTLQQLDAIATTTGPGLIGGVLVGTLTGKALASVSGRPFLAINHLEGHVLSARLDPGIEFPYLLLLVSGGHCQIIAVHNIGHYERLGATLDDALGEAFDKTAKLLGLGFPGGPAVEACAQAGDPLRFAFPQPLKGRDSCDFSFSGLKTAVRDTANALATTAGGLSSQDAADICASFQHTVGEIVCERLGRAFVRYAPTSSPARQLVVAGGVAANHYLRARLASFASEEKYTLVVPPPKLCTDNAAMIAWAGLERFQRGEQDGLDVEPRARWPL